MLVGWRFTEDQRCLRLWRNHRRWRQASLTSLQRRWRICTRHNRAYAERDSCQEGRELDGPRISLHPRTTLTCMVSPAPRPGLGLSLLGIRAWYADSRTKHPDNAGLRSLLFPNTDDCTQAWSHSRQQCACGSVPLMLYPEIYSLLPSRICAT